MKSRQIFSFFDFNFYWKVTISSEFCRSIENKSKSIRWVGDFNTPPSQQNGHIFFLIRTAELMKNRRILTFNFSRVGRGVCINHWFTSSSFSVFPSLFSFLLFNSFIEIKGNSTAALIHIFLNPVAYWGIDFFISSCGLLATPNALQKSFPFCLESWIIHGKGVRRLLFGTNERKWNY